MHYCYVTSGVWRSFQISRSTGISIATSLSFYYVILMNKCCLKILYHLIRSNLEVHLIIACNLYSNKCGSSSLPQTRFLPHVCISCIILVWNRKNKFSTLLLCQKIKNLNFFFGIAAVMLIVFDCNNSSWTIANCLVLSLELRFLIYFRCTSFGISHSHLCLS